ncbi:MAG: tetratricopeptide repeat protein [Saprospiraceae bacterium]|nr:tetratricopeptide repeat protein [Saprospiraceae bacterium]
MIQKILLTILVGFLGFTAMAQDPRLAFQYKQDGELEKAADLFKKLHEKSPGTDYYFNNYLECLIQMEQIPLAKEAIQLEIKKRPADSQLMVQYGNILDKIGEPDAAEEQYKKAVKTLNSDKFGITKLGNAFTSVNKLELAAMVYEKGEELFPGENAFAYNLADIYRRLGNTEKMVFYYLNSLEGNPGSLESIKTVFQRFLAEEDFVYLQEQLYSRMQANENSELYPELLAWIFLNKKDYRNAMRQLKALDRKLDENGQRVFNLAYQAVFDDEFDTAIDGFQYIVDEKGRNSSYYIEAKKGVLTTKRKKITDDPAYEKAALLLLETDFIQFLEEFGSNSLTAPIIIELADLQAYYIGETGRAIMTLSNLVQYQGINRFVLANAKLDLADLHLISGDRWEATLLYSQVDKDFEEELLGQEARFRNARLSYFVGDFEWAQQQFNILKTATSKFISNDALDLSVFIMDNLGLDSTDVPLKKYAEADLLIFQNRFSEAQTLLNEIRVEFPEHKLEDDILYLEAQLLTKQRDYPAAVAKYLSILERFPEEIRADNAMFALGELYEYNLNQAEEAMKYYERLFVEYNSSTLAIDARKRYRLLRGDSI